MKKLFLIAVACMMILQNLMLTQNILAVTAYPDPVQYRQPDGTTIMIINHGDEFVHWASTPDGYTILSNPQGYYEYAGLSHDGQLVFSGVTIHAEGLRTQEELLFLATIPKGLRFSETQVAEMKKFLHRDSNSDATMIGGFPTTGVRTHLMILANFSNTSTSYTQTNFNNLMNQVNYNSSGSFRDFYLEVSYGLLTVNTTVTAWVTLSHPHDYYGPESMWGQFAYDAVVAADQQVGINYALYDNNGNGIVDGICITHQGRGQEESGSTLDIWSHSWDLASAGFTLAQRTFDGVQITEYTTIPEKSGTSSMTNIGVMCHEFGHNLGSPDFYDTDYSTNGQYNGTGSWDVMASGSWNGSPSGSKPPHPNPWIKTYFTWTTPTVMTYQQIATVRNIQTYADVFRYNTTTSNEYFLVENRQQTGFNLSIPGHGMLIYHVDGNYISAHLNANDLNNGSHQGMYPVCANATGNPPTVYGSINSSGCPFPGTSSITSFTDATTPNSHSWAGANTNYPITNVTENTTTKEVTFCFIACAPPTDPSNFTASAMSTSQIDLTWGKNIYNNPVIVAYSPSGVFGTPVTGTTYSAGTTLPGGGTVLYNGGNTLYSHTSLGPNTTCYYKIWSILTGVTYSPGVTADATTFCTVISSFPWIEDFEHSGATPFCWTQSHQSGTLDWQFQNGGYSAHPPAAHSGSYNAILFIDDYTHPVTRIISPTLNLSGLSNPVLRFWHSQEFWAPYQDQLKVYYRSSPHNDWTLLVAFTANVIGWKSESILLPNPSSTYFLAFEGLANFSFGVCLDDVAVTENTMTWNGSGDWSSPVNWTPQYIPGSFDNIIINSGNCNLTSTVNAKSVTIQPSATFTTNPGVTVVNNGDLIINK